MDKANEELSLSKNLIEQKYFSKSLNCSYYAMFYAARALLGIKKLDSKKHSGVLKLFNINFIHSGEIHKEFYTFLSTSFNTRLQSDYHDFYVASLQDAEKQIQNAEKFLQMTKNYLSKYLEN